MNNNRDAIPVDWLYRVCIDALAAGDDEMAKAIANLIDEWRRENV